VRVTISPAGVPKRTVNSAIFPSDYNMQQVARTSVEYRPRQPQTEVRGTISTRLTTKQVAQTQRIR